MFFTGLTGLATWLILSILAVILINVLIHGWSGLSWRFVSTVGGDPFRSRAGSVLATNGQIHDLMLEVIHAFNARGRA